MKTKIVIVGIVVILLSVNMVLAQGPPPAAKVVIAKIVQQEVAENRSFLGTYYYDRVSNVSSEVAGLVNSVRVRAGESVNKGDLLLVLDTRILDKNIELNTHRIEQIAIKINNAERNYKRLQDLYKQEAVSEKNYEDQYDRYQELVKEREIAQIDLEKLQIQKEKSVIVAPFAGVVLSKNVDLGDWVNQGKALLSVGSKDDQFIRVPVAETLLQFIHTGVILNVTINAYNKQVQGTVVGIDPQADAKTKNVYLNVRVPYLENIAENMSASVFVPISAKKTLKIIPREAVIKFKGADFVYTIKDGKAAILPINIVTYLENSVAADNPYFVPGMAVVVEGNERLRPDQAVTVIGEK